MKLCGICKIMNVEEQSDKVLKCDVYFSTKVNRWDNKSKTYKEEYETDFIKGRIVGEAKEELDKIAETMDVEKLAIEVENSIFRNMKYTSKKDGQSKTWTEITIFKFKIPESKPTKSNKKYGRH